MSKYTYDRLQQVSDCQLRSRFHDIRYDLTNEMESSHKWEQTLAAQITPISMAEDMIYNFKRGIEPVSDNNDLWEDSESDSSDDEKDYTNNENNNFCKKSDKIFIKREKIKPYHYPDRLPPNEERYVFAPNVHESTKCIYKILKRIRSKYKHGYDENDNFYKKQVYTSTTLEKESNNFMVGIYSNKTLYISTVVDFIKFKANCRTYGKLMEVQRPANNKSRKKSAAEKGLLGNINELERKKLEITASLKELDKEMHKKRLMLTNADGKINEMTQIYLNSIGVQYAKKLDDIENLNDSIKRLQNIADELKPKPEIKFEKETQQPTKAEIWTPAILHPSSSELAEKERQNLFRNNFNIHNTFKMKYCDYVNKVLPTKGKHFYVDLMLPPRAYNQTRLSGLSLLDQLKTILKDAGLMSFNEIMIRLNEVNSPFTQKVIDEGEILKLLPQAGRLICGNWVPQSEVVYVLQQDRNFNGVHVKDLIRSRDYVVNIIL